MVNEKSWEQIPLSAVFLMLLFDNKYPDFCDLIEFTNLLFLNPDAAVQITALTYVLVLYV